MNEDILNELNKLNRNVSAVLAITVDRHLRDTDLAKPRPRSIDRMLADLGLTGAEIAKLLGKTPQAVSIALSKDKQTVKSKKANAKNAEQPVNDEERKQGRTQKSYLIKWCACRLCKLSWRCQVRPKP